ncbi:MAG: biotin carboxylase N-terminal domain-containing protein, partial [Brevibacterium yomogidense]|uniref:biotin carboxylase N-terminal domain-containing protein n=1 Tax=Brevibacterium sp. Mu109 TaxID=1255669 RepID=UPI0035B5075E
MDVGPKWWKVLKSTVLVANRGEIAVRLIDAVRAAGMTEAVISVSVNIRFFGVHQSCVQGPLR